MPPKNQRISSHLWKSLPKGSFWNGPLFDVRFGEFPDLRIACVVKAKLFRTNVDRNKARRLSYVKLNENLKGQKGFFIIYPKKTLLISKKDKVESEVKAFISSIK